MNNQYNAIEIGYEPNAHGLRLEGQHRVLCLGWADFLNRELGRWDLFSYYHLFTGNYVLCQWLDKDIKICKELETSFKSFENGGWSNLDFMRARLRPQEEIVAEMQSRQKKKASQEIYQRETDKEHKKDTVKWLKRRGMDDAALSLRNTSNFTSESTGIADNLIELTKSSGRKYYS